MKRYIILKLLSLLFIIAAVFACRPEPLRVDNIPRLEDELVISSYVIKDSAFFVYFSRTVNALKAGPDSDMEALAEEILVQDGQVKIIHNGQQYSMQMILPGVYSSQEVPQVVGDEYELYAYDKVLGKAVTSSTVMQEEVSFKTIDLEITENYDTIVTVDYSFDDPAGPNWYVMHVQRVTANLENYNVFGVFYHTELVADTGQQAQTIRGSFPSVRRSFKRSDTISVSLSNISKEYYDYLKLRNNVTYWFFQATQEAVNFPSNVETGHGFFTSHYLDYRTFDLSDY